MPLLISPLPRRAGKGHLLAWLIDAGLAKSDVGEITLRGRLGLVEVPERGAADLALQLDGTKLCHRAVQCWFESDAVDPTVQVHFAALRHNLEREAKAQAEQLRTARGAAGESDRSTSLRRLVLRESDLGLGGLHLLTLGRKNPMETLPTTRLKVGTPIELAAEDPALPFRQRGVVTRLEETAIELALRTPPNADDDVDLFRIDASGDETAFRRARTALRKAEHSTHARLAALRDVLLGAAPPQADPEEAPPSFLDETLNPPQRKAIARALAARDVAIIHGPPGTGKTTTLVELIRQARRRGLSVLACAPSNLAVDNLVEKLRAHQESVVRLGHPIRVLPQVREATLNELARSHRDMKLVKRYRADAMELFRKADRDSRAGMDRATRRALRDEAGSLLDDARSVEADIIQDLLREAGVVCATNTGLDVNLLGRRRFDLVVVDEACQCTEAEAWIPATRADRLVLAGDPCQLPPTVLSRDAGDAAISLPERLMAARPELADLLTVQYRMHEQIMAFSSEQFYDNELIAHAGVADHLLTGLGLEADEQTETPMHFIDTSGALFDEVREADDASTANPDEARIAAKKAADLIGFGLPAKDLAIITPYTAQVKAIRDALRDRGVEGVEVGTIDGFQGREKEAIIISLVRSNPEGHIGFLADTRRMNVALTRARRKLVVIGDSATLATHTFYRDLLDHFGTFDAYHVVWEEED